MTIELILASASPRRKQLLLQIGLTAEAYAADIDETALPGESAEDYVLRLAELKAKTAADKYYNDIKATGAQNILIIGSDTSVVVDKRILGKPLDKADAISMWHLMSGRSHQVLSSVAILHYVKVNQQGDTSLQLSELKRCISVNTVTMRNILEQEMHSYWDSGEPADKAGAYAVQGMAAKWIEKIEGSFSGIMGLPLYELSKMLEDYDMDIL